MDIIYQGNSILIISNPTKKLNYITPLREGGIYYLINPTWMKIFDFAGNVDKQRMQSITRKNKNLEWLTV